MKRYSYRREAILKALRATHSHPSASQIYEEVKKEIPGISLGTVYRNLSQLAASGEILGISVNDGFEHFDGDCHPHLHLHCMGCGKIIDAPICQKELADIARQHGFTPDRTVCVIDGICDRCRSAESTSPDRF